MHPNLIKIASQSAYLSFHGFHAFFTTINYKIPPPNALSMSAPFVSVIIPTHNRMEPLEKCLARVCSQDYPKKSYEIMVVDDYSTDGTPSLVRMLQKKHHNLHYLQIQRKSPGAARNAGLAKAKGEIIAFTDDDCVAPHDWISSLVKEFLGTDTAAVGGAVSNPTNRYIAHASHLLNFYPWLPAGKKRFMKEIPTANVAYRRASIQGMLFPEFPNDSVYEDSLFNYALYRKEGKILFCPNIIVEHHAWGEDDGLKKFFLLQRKKAYGFLRGGYIVHGKKGTLLRNIKILNIFCPGFFAAFWGSLRAGNPLRFLFCSPPILAGYLYRGGVILLTRDISAWQIPPLSSRSKTRR